MAAPASDRRAYVVRAAHALFPLVLTCEHASWRLPCGLPRAPALREVLRTHWGWDIGAWALTREIAGRLHTSAIGGRWSRLWIDLNRRVDEATLIRTRIDELVLPWNRRLGMGEVQRRIETCHVPYHVAVDRLLARRLLRGVRPSLLAVHSFTPELEGHAPRPFDIGILYERHARAAHRLGRTLGRAGLTVRYNEPYSGMAGMMYAADRHGAHHRLPCLELEVNQSLFAKRGAAGRLGALLARTLKEMPLS
jgi:predicted N-formylglutamate amidohydrolase